MAHAATFPIRLAGGVGLILIGLAMLALPIGFIVWARHMFTVGINIHAAPMGLLIPGVPALAWILGSAAIIAFGAKLLRAKGVGSNARPPTVPEP